MIVGGTTPSRIASVAITASRPPAAPSRCPVIDFVLDTSAALAVISVGADNDYGHPAPETLALLDRLGAITYRTDQDGTIAIVERAGQLAVVTER